MFSKLLTLVSKMLDVTALPQLSAFSTILGDDPNSSSRDDLLRFSARRLLSLPFGSTFFNFSKNSSNTIPVPAFGAYVGGIIAEVSSNFAELSQDSLNFFQFCISLNHFLSIKANILHNNILLCLRSPSHSSSSSFFPRTNLLSSLPDDAIHTGGFLFASGLNYELQAINTADIGYYASIGKYPTIGLLLGLLASSYGSSCSPLHTFSRKMMLDFLSEPVTSKNAKDSDIFVISCLVFGLSSVSSCNINSSTFILDLYKNINSEVVEKGLFVSFLPVINLVLSISLGLTYFGVANEVPASLLQKLNLYLSKDGVSNYSDQLFATISLSLIYFSSNSLVVSKMVNPDLTDLELEVFPSISLIFLKSFCSYLVCPVDSLRLLMDSVEAIKFDSSFVITEYRSKCLIAQVSGMLVALVSVFLNSTRTDDVAVITKLSLNLFSVILSNFSIIPSFLSCSICLVLGFLYFGTCSSLAISLVQQFQAFCQSPDQWFVSSLVLGFICCGEGKFVMNYSPQNIPILLASVLSLLIPCSSGVGKGHYCPIQYLSSFLLLLCLKEKS
ncbi:hypothetical protein RCL1_007204 [Eukaryota sp. TZLM3-RCL]